jgi:hypothetical protein
MFLALLRQYTFTHLDKSVLKPDKSVDLPETLSTPSNRSRLAIQPGADSEFLQSLHL